MDRARPIPPLALDGAERETLEQWTRRPKTAQGLALRARIVLACADGRSNTGVAAELRVCVGTVGKWRSRFLEQRLDGLLDQPRSGRPRVIDDADVERVIALTLETTPKDATHWSTRSMARRCGLSHNTVSRIWRAFALQPHRTETFKLSADPLFIEKVRDIVGLYLDPPDRALVLCVDEKSQIQDLDKFERDRRDHLEMHEAVGVPVDMGEDTEEARDLWNRMTAIIIAQPRVTDHAWDAWLARVSPRMGEGGELILLVPTPHNITWLERNLDLLDCYNQAGGTAYLRLVLAPAIDGAAH